MKKRFFVTMLAVCSAVSLSYGCSGQEGVIDPPPPYIEDGDDDNRQPAPEPGTYRVIGYLPTSVSSYTPRWDKVNVINLSFARVKADGTLDDAAVRNAFGKFAEKAHKNNVQVVVALGGAANTDNFNTALVSEQGRKNIIDGCVALMKDLDLDGIDVDYEGWDWGASSGNIPKKAGYAELISGLRQALGKDALLTAALGGNATENGFYSKEVLEMMDYVTLMAYDKTGPWSSKSGPHSPFEYFDSFVKSCLKIGLTRTKIIPGVPFYGYVFPGNKPADARSMSYKEIISKYPGAENRDAVEDAFLWYDGIPMMTKKCQYVVNNKLGGIMIWQLAQDSSDGGKSLLDVINNTLFPEN